MSFKIKKAIELFGDMQSKHGCRFKEWCYLHLDRWNKILVDADKYEIVENALFPLYEEFEIKLDDFVIDYCANLSEEDVDVPDDVIDNFIKGLELSCLLKQ